MFGGSYAGSPASNHPPEPDQLDSDQGPRAVSHPIHPIQCRYDVRLVETAVHRAIQTRSGVSQQLFHREREAAYGIADPDARDERFGQVHRRWFARLGLGRPLDRALAEARASLTQVEECRVATAVSRKDELADLFDRSAVGDSLDGVQSGVDLPANASKVILVRLRPEAFLDPPALLAFLRHEFLHLADILDPSFAYQRRLPCVDAGPSYDHVLRNRYRVVWDTTIDGRLLRRGFANPEVRSARFKEFRAAFPMLGGEVGQEFERWFDAEHPTHERLVAFIRDPASFGDTPEGRFAGRCPICRFPTAVLDPHPERLSEEAREELHDDYPWWRLELGVCSQCVDLYQARHASSAPRFTSNT